MARCSSYTVVIKLVIFLSITAGVRSVLMKTPNNVVVEAGTDVTMECSSDQSASAIIWLYDSVIVTSLCRTSNPPYVTKSTINDCHLTVLGNYSVQGPYQCSDGPGSNAQAVAIVIDPKPTCGVASSPIRGENVTLSCIMTYRRLTDVKRQIPGAGFTASISWEPAAGTLLSNSSTAVVNNVGETLQVDVMTLVSGTEIPSYNCTSTFYFTDRQDQYITHALNSVSWTCTSAPVNTWYCPSSVTVTPSSGPFNEGDVLTCTSDGYPQPSFQWTDSDGVVVSTTSTMTLTGGSFNLTCTATGNFTTSCSASNSVSGYANATVTPRHGNMNESDDIQPWMIIVIVVVAVFLIVLIVVIIIIAVNCRRRKDQSKINSNRETNVEMDKTDVSYKDLSTDISTQSSAVWDGKDLEHSADFGYEAIVPVYAQVNRSHPKESDQPQYAEIAPRQKDAVSSAENRNPPRKPDDSNYAAIVHKPNIQQSDQQS